MMFTIGSFAELTGVSAKRLRHYDTLELFRPAWTDPDSHYRYYLAAQIPELQRIVALRDLGIPLIHHRQSQPRRRTHCSPSWPSDGPSWWPNAASWTGG